MVDKISEEEIKALKRLRDDKLYKALALSKIREILTKYYPKGTKVEITKDYINVKIEDEK